MFGFDGNINGFHNIIQILQNNEDGQFFSHKEVRAYARCFLILLPKLDISLKTQQEIQCLLATMSLAGLPHYDRCFLASRIYKLLNSEIYDHTI